MSISFEERDRIKEQIRIALEPILGVNAYVLAWDATTLDDDGDSVDFSVVTPARQSAIATYGLASMLRDSCVIPSGFTDDDGEDE